MLVRNSGKFLLAPQPRPVTSRVLLAETCCQKQLPPRSEYTSATTPIPGGVNTVQRTHDSQIFTSCPIRFSLTPQKDTRFRLCTRAGPRCDVTRTVNKRLGSKWGIMVKWLGVVRSMLRVPEVGRLRFLAHGSPRVGLVVDTSNYV
ncbi:hypothetical protein CY34DRAFT_198186 [Suillus luteus UH-Slu-Lm8-n1]|uniref:Uncharacterized protein n=1 Tax=Suillus luteus UH-Slu-Lm8-n1 TaxID=930992 RepID=A0A0D0AUF9_9AGAM|nr:hypothetical protein CY34DRAFT_198186 [Suillus luteus UH-Slu-Lm8-n1]